MEEVEFDELNINNRFLFQGMLYIKPDVDKAIRVWDGKAVCFAPQQNVFSILFGMFILHTSL